MNKKAKLFLITWVFVIINHSCVASDDGEAPSTRAYDLARQIALMEEELKRLRTLEARRAEVVEHPVERRLTIPPIAQGSEFLSKIFKGILDL